MPRETEAQRRGFTHPEAFCLTDYLSADGHVRETIWNSRDGVTPFIVHTDTGVELQHVDWHLDRCVPELIPPIGQRIFVDYSKLEMEEFTRSQIEQYWDATEWPMRERYGSKDKAFEELTAHRISDVRNGAPSVRVVDEALWRELIETQAERATRAWQERAIRRYHPDQHFVIPPRTTAIRA